MEKRTFKTTLIAGITGSGGSYLADYIVEHHPEVAVHRRQAIQEGFKLTDGRLFGYCEAEKQDMAFFFKSSSGR
jgi:GDP-D-mannose dehydratase